MIPECILTFQGCLGTINNRKIFFLNKMYLKKKLLQYFIKIIIIIYRRAINHYKNSDSRLFFFPHKVVKIKLIVCGRKKNYPRKLPQQSCDTRNMIAISNF